MKPLSVAIRFTLACLATAMAFKLLLFVSLVAWIIRRPPLHARVRVQQWWGRQLESLFGLHTTVEGTPPTGNFILVSNHLGYLDIMLLAARMPAVFVAKSEIASWPLIGACCRLGNTLFIDRKRMRDVPRVLEQIEEVRVQDVGIMIFPEGHTSDGSRVREFRSPLLECAVRGNVPVHYVTLNYQNFPGDVPARYTASWIDSENIFKHTIRIMKQKGLMVKMVFGDQPMIASDRKELARRLHEAVSSNFVPIEGSEARKDYDRANSTNQNKTSQREAVSR